MALRWPLLTVPWAVIVMLYIIFIIGPCLAVIIVITLPYTLFYRSSNWSMRERDMPPLQLCLDHFQSLYPQLVSSIVTAYRLSPQSPHRQLPSAIDFWSTKRDHHRYCIPCVGTLRTKHYEYSHIAGFFIALESAGWSRRTLLIFLRDEVERRSGLVRPEEKEAFTMVMEKLCTHDFMSWVKDKLRGSIRFLAKWMEAPLKEWDGDVPMGMRAIRVSLDSVDWVLERGALLIPEDNTTRNCMRVLATLPMWRKVENGEDLQMGLENYWQIMATR